MANGQATKQTIMWSHPNLHPRKKTPPVNQRRQVDLPEPKLLQTTELLPEQVPKNLAAALAVLRRLPLVLQPAKLTAASSERCGRDGGDGLVAPWPALLCLRLQVTVVALRLLIAGAVLLQERLSCEMWQQSYLKRKTLQTLEALEILASLEILVSLEILACLQQSGAFCSCWFFFSRGFWTLCVQHQRHRVTCVPKRLTQAVPVTSVLESTRGYQGQPAWS